MNDINWYIDKRLVHEFHTSERKSFRGCRRRWNWIFRENYYPKMTAKPLDFGTAYHAAEEVYYNPDTWKWDRDIVLEAAIKAFKDKNDKQRKVAHEANLFKTEEEIDTDFDERVELAVGMLRYQHKVISPKEDQDWHPVKVEIEFFVPIPHPDTNEYMWCKCGTCWTRHGKYYNKILDEQGEAAANAMEQEIFVDGEWPGLPVIFAGRIDALGEDEHGDLWIIDWKTAARIPDNHQFLEMDDQVGSYPWALWSLGMKVRGFIYAEQKKGFPQPPKRNKNIRLGRMYSVAENQDTDYETYLATVKEHDALAYNAGLYDNFLQFLLDFGTTFYHRAQIHKSEEELLEIQKNLGQEVLDMIDPHLRIYPNPGRWSCDNCAFQVPCLEQNRGSDFTYGLETLFEKRKAYYLREEPSTDKKSAQ